MILEENTFAWSQLCVGLFIIVNVSSMCVSRNESQHIHVVYIFTDAS